MTARTVEKISVVVVVAVLGAALAVNVRGAPVALLVAAMVVTVSAGMDLVLRAEARYRPTPDVFILPAALVIGGVSFISLLASGTSIVLGLAVLATLLFAVFWAEFSSLSGGVRRGTQERRLAETALIVVGYVAAFLLYAAVYQARTRSLLSAPAIIAISFLLAARQLRLAHEPDADGDGEPETPSWPRTLMYSAAVALAVGEITWALNYWPLNGLLGGAFLLASFYFLIGVFSQHLQRRLSARLVLEYGTVSALGVALITAAGLIRRGL
jgi:hypothetical protein